MPAYIVLTRERTRNAEELAKYSELVTATLAGHPVKPRVIFGRHQILEGASVEGMAILEFPTFEDAQAWYQSPAYRKACEHRHLGADFSCMIVEGL